MKSRIILMLSLILLSQSSFANFYKVVRDHKDGTVRVTPVRLSSVQIEAYVLADTNIIYYTQGALPKPVGVPAKHIGFDVGTKQLIEVSQAIKDDVDAAEVVAEDARRAGAANFNNWSERDKAIMKTVLEMVNSGRTNFTGAQVRARLDDNMRP